MLKGYFHATYFAGSFIESDSLVDKCLGLMLKGYFMLLILLEVSVKVTRVLTDVMDY